MICLDPSKEGALRMLPGIDKLENYGLSPEILVTRLVAVKRLYLNETKEIMQCVRRLFWQ